MPHLSLSSLLLATLAACAASMPMNQSTTASTTDDASVHVRCARVRPGMNHGEALALIGRAPDSTLSGHTAAGPDGDPPAGSYAIDFWNEADAQGRQRVSSLHYSGGVIEAVDCGRLTDESDSPTPPHSPET